MAPIMTPEEGVELLSKDEETIWITHNAAMQSGLLKDLFENVKGNKCNILEVNGDILEMVVKWSEAHKDDLRPPDSGFASRKRIGGVQNQDQWLSQGDHRTLCHIAFACDYLDNELLETVCKIVANMIRGKSVTELRKIFNTGPIYNFVEWCKHPQKKWGSGSEVFNNPIVRSRIFQYCSMKDLKTLHKSAVTRFSKDETKTIESYCNPLTLLLGQKQSTSTTVDGTISIDGHKLGCLPNYYPPIDRIDAWIGCSVSQFPWDEYMKEIGFGNPYGTGENRTWYKILGCGTTICLSIGLYKDSGCCKMHLQEGNNELLPNFTWEGSSFNIVPFAVRGVFDLILSQLPWRYKKSGASYDPGNHEPEYDLTFAAERFGPKVERVSMMTSAMQIANVKRSHMVGFEDVTAEFSPESIGLKKVAEELKDVLFPIYGKLFIGTYKDRNIMYNGIINAFNQAISHLGKQERGE